MVVGVLEEMRSRNVLAIAVKGRCEEARGVRTREDKELEPLLSFVIFFITNPLYTNLLVTVANEILSGCGEVWLGIDQYGSIIGHQSMIDAQLVKLREVLKCEIHTQKDVFQVLGMVDLVEANAQ